METEDILPFFITTRHWAYTEPAKSISHPHPQFFKISYNIPHLTPDISGFLFPSDYQIKL
jgi:hypothetical protein